MEGVLRFSRGLHSGGEWGGDQAPQPGSRSPQRWAGTSLLSQPWEREEAAGNMTRESSLRGAGLKLHGGGAALVGGQAGEENPALAQAFQKFAPFPLKLPTPPRLCLPEWHFRFRIQAPGSVPHCAGRGEAEGGAGCPLPGLPGDLGEGRPLGSSAGLWGSRPSQANGQGLQPPGQCSVQPWAKASV